LQKKLDRPPYPLEILQVIKKERGFDIFTANRITIIAHLYELCRKDIIYSSKVHQQFSFDRFSEEYRKFSEILEQDYPGFALGANNRTLVATTARTVNL
jgi:hypothetical protein